MWTKNYGGLQHDHAFCVQQTTDGGYIQVGHSVSFAPSGGFYLVKTNANGDTSWTKKYTSASGSSKLNSIQQTTDGGYVIGGEYDPNIGGGLYSYLIKTNTTGDTLWTKKTE